MRRELPTIEGLERGFQQGYWKKPWWWTRQPIQLTTKEQIAIAKIEQLVDSGEWITDPLVRMAFWQAVVDACKAFGTEPRL